MIYRIKGRLCGYLCNDCREPLSRERVRIYRPAGGAEVAALAVANPKETFAILSEEAVRAKADRLLAEVETDDQGAYEIVIDEKSGYQGGPFEVDVLAERAPHQKALRRPRPPVQFTITTLQIRWREGEGGLLGAWEYCLPARYWCAVRARLGAWVICGRLLTCETQAPIAGATVQAFDADWLQDDDLGTALTGADGRFRIDYVADDFTRTPFSPLFNFEIGGPDVYFKAMIAGITLIDEHQADGRKPGRENVGPCFCVSLCSDAVQPTTPDEVPHWQQVEIFDIHPAAPDSSSKFTAQGYAGGAAAGIVFGGLVALKGNCPLVNAANTASALEYRFTIGEWGWPGGADDPTTIPSVPPASMQPVTSIGGTLVGYVFYTNALGGADSADVVVSSTDPNGWIHLLGAPVQVDMRDGTTSTVPVTTTNFLRTFDLISLNTVAITSVHAPRTPSIPVASPGAAPTVAQQEPIRRYTLQFEVRDHDSGATIYTDTLSSIILDNTPVVYGLNLEQLLANQCNPLAGAANVYVLYTVDHPHLSSFGLDISNNSGSVHPGIAGANYTSGSYFFRGGVSGPDNGMGTGGLRVGVNADPPCAYSVNLRWQTRHYVPDPQNTQKLYCK